MAYDRCPSCKGKKTILALGNMTRKCPTCKGVGHVAVVEPVVDLVEPPMVSENVSRETCVALDDVPVRIKRKPGRKSKMVACSSNVVLNASQ